MGEGDSAKTAVPVVLGAGLLALFTLPNLSIAQEDWDGDTYTVFASFGEVRFGSQFAGAEWTVWVALLGVAAAIFAALFFRTDGTQPRQKVMGIGALMGLFYPTGLALLTGSDLFMDFFGVLSWGVWLFWLACIAAAVIAFQNAEEAPASVYQSSAPGYSPAYLSALTSRTLTIASSTSGQCAQTVGQAEMRESPDVSAIVLAQIPAGSTLTLQERVVWAPRPMWIKVMDDRSDTVGYVNGMSLKPG